MSKALEYYHTVKHQDTWNVDVVYPEQVGNIIKIALFEGAINALRLYSPIIDTSQDVEKLEKELQKLLDSLKQ